MLAHTVISAAANQWEPILPAWRELLDAVDDELRVFMSPEFLGSWIDTFGDSSMRPHLVAFHVPSGACVGLAPWVLQRVSARVPAVRLSTLGAPWADYTDILAPASYRSEVTAAAASYLDSIRGVQMLELGPSGTTSVTAQVWGRLMCWRPHAAREQVCPWFRVGQPRAPDNVRALRRCHRRAAELGPLSFSVVRTPAEAAEALEVFFDLHRRRWADTSTPSRFLRPANRRFLQAVAARLLRTGNLHLSALRIGGSVAAVHLGFVTAKSLQYYMPTWNPDFQGCGPGRLLLDALARDCIDRGLERFDLLRGAEPYKDDWADGRSIVRSWSGFRRTWSGAAVRAYYDARTAFHAFRSRGRSGARPSVSTARPAGWRYDAATGA